MTEERSTVHPLLIFGVMAAVVAKEYWTMVTFLP